MLRLVSDRSLAVGHPAPPPADEFGVWIGYDIPEDRAGWHPLVRRLYDYWRSLAPPGRLPGRRDLVAEDIASLWSRAWMLDVFRDPLRYRYRLCGTEMVRSLGREVTGQWLDEAHPALIANPQSRERFHFMVETGRATWRRGIPLWRRDPKHQMIETLIVPLADDGRTVDKMLAVSVLFDGAGRPI
jgi:PAS domain